MKEKLKGLFKMPGKKPRQEKKAKGQKTGNSEITFIVLTTVFRAIQETNFLVERIVKAVGKKLAEKNLPSPEETTPPPVEKWIRAKYQALVHILGTVIFGHIAKMFNIFYFKRDDLKLFFQDPHRYYEVLKKRLLEKWDKAIEASKKKFTEIIQWLKEKIEDLKEQIKTVKENLLELSKELEIKPSNGKIDLVKKVYFIWITIIVIADIVAIATALSVMRENMVFTYALTVGIATSLIVCSDLSGIMLKSYHHKKEKRKWLIPLVVASFAFLITLFLGEARLYYLSQADGVDFPPLIRYGFTALNFFFYFVSTYASYHLHHKNLPKAREYNSLLNKKKRLDKEINKTVKELDKVEQKELAEVKEIDGQFQSELDGLNNKEFELRENIAEATEQIDMSKATFFEHFRLINQYNKKKTQRFRTINHLHRTDKKTCKYWEKEVPDLAFEFEDYGFAYPYKNGVLNFDIHYEDYIVDKVRKDDEIKSEKPGTSEVTSDEMEVPDKVENSDGKVSRLNSKPRNLPAKFVFPVITFLLALFSMGCQKTEPIATSVIAIVDRTPDAKSDAYKLTASKVLKIMHIDENEGAVNYGDFSLTTINNVSRNVYNTVSLEAGSALENKFTRKEKLEDFEKEIEKFIDDAYISNYHFDQSKIHSTICEAAEILQSKQSQRKVLIIFSDMLENSKVSFYEDIQKQTPYGVLITELEYYGGIIPDLSGIEIIVIFNTTDPQVDELVREAQKFWKFYLEENKGAKVSFKANL